MVRILKNRGQSTLEYAVVIAVIIGALLATQVYFKRGIQGRFKQSADDIGEQFAPGSGHYTTKSNSTVTSTESTKAGTAGNVVPTTAGRAKATQTDTDQVQNRTTEEKVGAFDNDYGLGPK